MIKPLLFAGLLALVTVGCAPKPKPVTLDVFFTGGLIYDGSGTTPYAAHVGVANGKITLLDPLAEQAVNATETLDISGLWIAPGFIDAHSHAMLEVDFGNDAIPYLTQGITTVVLGLDGDGTTDVADRFAQWQSTGIGVNGMHFAGHGYIRSQVMGREDRAPNDDEMVQMKGMLSVAMEQGAFGLSTGLFYVPGTYASTEEVIELARMAAAYPNAIYDTHDRDLGAVYEGVGYEASVEEGIRITEESGLRGIFSHYNLQGAHNYGRAEVGAKLINNARDRGVDIWAAQHPYTATQSNLRSYTIPDWAAAGGREAMLARFDDLQSSGSIREATNAMLQVRGGAGNIKFVDPREDLNGRTLTEVANTREESAADTVQWILRTGNAVVMNLELYDHNNTRRLAQEPWMMTCTDGRTPRPDQPMTHPRAFGAFPKKMRHFVFEEKLLTPEFVIRSFSGLAADFYQLNDRGYIKDGYIADMVVIDPMRYRDLATFDQPQRLSEGVVHALVNGRFAIRNEQITGTLAGMPIARPNTPAAANKEP
jgi:N-acyl-D-amino-acid deacylase